MLLVVVVVVVIAVLLTHFAARTLRSLKDIQFGGQFILGVNICSMHLKCQSTFSTQGCDSDDTTNFVS